VILDNPDRPDGRHGLICAAFRRVAEPVRGGATEQAAAIEKTEVAAAEAHDGVVVFRFREADELGAAALVRSSPAGN
jgi:hypothetical protein